MCGEWVLRKEPSEHQLCQRKGTTLWDPGEIRCLRIMGLVFLISCWCAVLNSTASTKMNLRTMPQVINLYIYFSILYCLLHLLCFALRCHEISGCDPLYPPFFFLPPYSPRCCNFYYESGVKSQESTLGRRLVGDEPWNSLRDTGVLEIMWQTLEMGKMRWGLVVLWKVRRK